MIVALVCARGGSKGLPQKNIRSFVGKPLIAHSIEMALNSKFIADVVVSTDDESLTAGSSRVFVTFYLII